MLKVRKVLVKSMRECLGVIRNCIAIHQLSSVLGSLIFSFSFNLFFIYTYESIV